MLPIGTENPLQTVFDQLLQRAFELRRRISPFELKEIQIAAPFIEMKAVQLDVRHAEGDLVERLRTRHIVLALQMQQTKIIGLRSTVRAVQFRICLLDLSLCNHGVPRWRT